MGSLGLLSGPVVLLVPIPIGAKVTLAVLIILSGLVMLWQAKRSSVSLSVSDSIRWQCGDVIAELPPEQVKSIFISRPNLIGQATEYKLIATLNGHTVRLLFAEHWFSGADAMETVRLLEQRLGVPVEDPSGELWRKMPFPPARWMGRGEEWKLMIFVSLLTLVVGFGAALALGVGG